MNLTSLNKKEFIKEIFKIIDRWSFEQCAYCEDGTMISIDGMLDFKCGKCGKTMIPLNYLGEIAKIIYNYREKKQFLKTESESK
ncbi:hypothetical protein LCGC14_1320120 [marine sediment metagenome]|uniref:Uncharacterized protein n=1 Tax=marine sediment metagenome TaxID=412755 RepID=A0A0F9KJU0_9ZZZZ